MLTGKEDHCSVRYKVFRSICNVLRKGVAGVKRVGGAECGNCGRDIQDGRSSR